MFHLGAQLVEEVDELVEGVTVAERVPLGRTLAEKAGVAQADEPVGGALARQRRQEARRLAVVALALVVRQQLEGLALRVLSVPRNMALQLKLNQTKSH